MSNKFCRIIIYINNKSIYIPINNIIIKIKLQNWQKLMVLLNIYNLTNDNLINILKLEIHQCIKLHEYEVILAREDFNLHHSL